MRALCSFLIVAWSWSATAAHHALDVAAPPQIAIEGGARLSLSGQARRTHRLGTLDLYTIALYSDGPADSLRLASADVAKALRIAGAGQADTVS